MHLLDLFRKNPRPSARPVGSSATATPADSSPGEARRPRIGLALSSGGAKGLAHIGVIQVLEENGIEVDAVAGASMGAYVGGMWASGIDGSGLQELAAEVTCKRDLWSVIDPVFPPRRGFIRGRKVRERLERSLDGMTFADMERPLFIVATEFESLERRVFREGDVASAVVASLAVPGIVVPAVREGVEYIDGGVSDPLPVSALQKFADVDRIIAVNVIPPVGARRRRPRGPRPLPRRILAALNEHLNYFAPGNLLDILRGAAMGSQMRLVQHSSKRSDVLISATTPRTRWHDYHRYAHYIRVGRRAAEEALPEIRRLLERTAEAETRCPKCETETETETETERKAPLCA